MSAVLHHLLQWDRHALLWINFHRSHFLDALLGPVSAMGELGIIWILMSLLLIFAIPRYRRTGILLLATMIIADRLIAAPLGQLLFRPRPYMAIPGVWQWGIRWGGASFPSGHAVSVWLATVILGCRIPKLRIPLIIFALLTSYSRPYFGMHYPLDVIGGTLLGIACGFAAVWIDRWLQRHVTVRTR